MAKTEKQLIQFTEGQFFVSPKEIFCGDKVLLQYQNILTDDVAIILGNELPLSITNPQELVKLIKVNPLLCSVENFEISLSGNLLTVQIQCVGWQVGKISYPNIKLELKHTLIEIPATEFTVSSILEKTGESSVKSAMGPILVPGTTYTVYGVIFLGIVILGLFIFALTKSSKIVRFFKNIFISYKYKKNYKKSLGMLKKLKKNSQDLSDKDFAEELQNIMRNFFAFRFSDKIYNLATAEIITWFSSIYNLILPEQAETAIHLFYELMIRCDFLRFSGNSVKGADFSENEIDQLIEKAGKIMQLIEEGCTNA